MYQVAIGGYYLAADGVDQYYDNPVYYEPGFRPISALELSVPQSDRIYVLIRNRLNASETNFDPLVLTNLNSVCKDTTNGEDVPSNIYQNTLHSDWNTDPSMFTPYVMYLDAGFSITNPVVRARSIDCCITDGSDNSFISFRIIVSDENLYFHYIPVVVSRMNERYAYTAVGREAYMYLSDQSDSYLLFSPFAYLKESTRNDYDFSYPLNSVFYKRQDTYNKEDFEFSIGSSSHSFVADNISLINVPDFSKASALHVDAHMYKDLVDEGSSAYVYIRVEGKTSGIIDNFKVNFLR